MRLIPMPENKRLAEALASLQHLLTGMFDLVTDQLQEALQAALTNDAALAAQVHQRDDLVDSMEMKIDSHCAHILSEMRPQGPDLRMLMAALKVTTDLERIGDHCKNLAKEVAGTMRTLDSFKALGEATTRMLYRARQTFEDRDAALAWALVNEDSKVRGLHARNVACIVAQCSTDRAGLEAAAYLVGMSKALERVADHAVNIAENVVFWIEGVDVRHPKLQRSGAHAVPGKQYHYKPGSRDKHRHAPDLH